MTTKSDIMIVIPCRNEIRAVVFSDLVSCALHGAMFWASRFPGSAFQVQTFARAHVVEARNAATTIARDLGIEWVLWLDDDMAPPHDLLQRLIETGKDFVGAVAYKRAPPYEPCVGRMIDGKVEHYDPDPEEGLIEAEMTGFACVLTHRRVLDAVFEATEGRPFQWRPGMPEDSFFCYQARRLGIPIHILSSVVVGHAGDLVVGREHRLAALAQAQQR